MIYYDVNIFYMNIIENIQKSYLPGFYQGRYNSRKQLILSIKSKIQKNPQELSLYQLRIALKVLQQFNLLPKHKILQDKQLALKQKIIQSSVTSSIISAFPYAIRQFHRYKFVRKLLWCSGIFCGVNYLMMRTTFNTYIEQCQNVARDNIYKFTQNSQLPK